MKQRIISGTLCVVVLAAVLCLYKTVVLEAAISVLSAIAVYELLSAVGLKNSKTLVIFDVAVAAILPYASIFNLQNYVVYAFLAVTVVLLLRNHSKIGFEKVAFSVCATLGVSLSFLCIILLRNNFDKTGLFYILIAFGGAWFADTGAYFSGRFFGKHKLCPVISPKKTIEGLIGGVISNILLICLAAFVYGKFVDVTVNYLALSILAVVIAFAGVAGDLTASVIKRQSGIKDYGNIIPGHGGIMDRFDSILLTAPAVYIVTKIVSIVF